MQKKKKKEACPRNFLICPQMQRRRGLKAIWHYRFVRKESESFVQTFSLGLFTSEFKVWKIPCQQTLIGWDSLPKRGNSGKWKIGDFVRTPIEHLHTLPLLFFQNRAQGIWIFSNSTFWRHTGVLQLAEMVKKWKWKAELNCQVKGTWQFFFGGITPTPLFLLVIASFLCYWQNLNLLSPH